MARTIEEIQAEMVTRVEVHPVLGPLLTSTSATALWRLFLYIVAASIWTLEVLFDKLKSDINETIASMKPHSLRSYAQKAKAFQYGYDLAPEEDFYDNTGLTEQQVTASKIVSYAAVVEQAPGLRIKVAKTSGSDLAPLSAPELLAFKAYMDRVRDAGVRLNITSTTADKLRLVIRIKYNALVIDYNGAMIDGTSATPVKDAIKSHLKNLPFNGIFSIQKLVDAIQDVDGVDDLSLDQAETKYGALPFTSVNIDRIPDSGYLRIDDADLTVTYIAS